MTDAYGTLPLMIEVNTVMTLQIISLYHSNLILIVNREISTLWWLTWSTL